MSSRNGSRRRRSACHTLTMKILSVLHRNFMRACQQAKEQAEWNEQQKRKQAEEEGQGDQMEQAAEFLKLSTARLTKVGS